MFKTKSTLRRNLCVERAKTLFFEAHHAGNATCMTSMCQAALPRQPSQTPPTSVDGADISRALLEWYAYPKRHENLSDDSNPIRLLLFGYRIHTTELIFAKKKISQNVRRTFARSHLWCRLPQGKYGGEHGWNLNARS